MQSICIIHVHYILTYSHPGEGKIYRLGYLARMNGCSCRLVQLVIPAQMHVGRERHLGLSVCPSFSLLLSFSPCLSGVSPSLSLPL